MNRAGLIPTMVASPVNRPSVESHSFYGDAGFFGIAVPRDALDCVSVDEFSDYYTEAQLWAPATLDDGRVAYVDTSGDDGVAAASALRAAGVEVYDL